MFEVYQSARFLLSLEGFFTPEPADIVSSHGRNLTTPVHCRISPFKYPRFRDPLKSHLVCPTSAVEGPATTADFFPPDETTTAHGFIERLPLDLSALYAYAGSPSVEATRKLESAGRRIGNAIDLTAWVIQTAADDGAEAGAKGVAHTDWNLDSDRGYGYKVWSGDIPDGPDDQDGQVLEEAFEVVSPD